MARERSLLPGGPMGRLERESSREVEEVPIKNKAGASCVKKTLGTKSRRERKHKNSFITWEFSHQNIIKQKGKTSGKSSTKSPKSKLAKKTKRQGERETGCTKVVFRNRTAGEENGNVPWTEKKNGRRGAVGLSRVPFLLSTSASPEGRNQ